MSYTIRNILYLLVFFISLQAALAQGNRIITTDDLQAGIIDLDCGDVSLSYRRFIDKYDVFDDRRYILVMPSGRSQVLYETDKKYQLLLAKKAHQYRDRHFSVLLSRGNDKEAFVAYYPDFPTQQELYDAGDLCTSALGSHCYHAVFHDKDDTYCFQYVKEDNRPFFVHIIDFLSEYLE